MRIRLFIIIILDEKLQIVPLSACKLLFFPIENGFAIGGLSAL